MSYGQNFGNWQQYAGFNKLKPFGAMAEQVPKPNAAVEPPKNVPVEDIAPVPVQSNIPMGQFGSQPQGSFGSNSAGQFGTIQDAVTADEHNY